MRSRSAPTSARPGSAAAFEDLAPGENRVAGEQRRDVPAAVDRRDVEGVGEAVEAQRARQRDDVAAVDQPPAEPALALAELVEMHLGGVLVEAGRDLVLGLLDGDAVDMVDALARRVVAPAMGRAGEREIVGGGVDLRAGGAELGRRDRRGQIGDMGLRRRPRRGRACAPSPSARSRARAAHAG